MRAVLNLQLKVRLLRDMPHSISAKGELLADHDWDLADASRYDLVESLSTAGPVWPRLAGLWDAIGRSFQPGSEAAGSSEDSRISLALGLAKLERNLIAGLAEHQDPAS